MQLKTTDFVFDIVPDDGQCIEVTVKKQVEVPSAIHGSDWEWKVSQKKLYLMKDVPFIEGVQKMIKWAYTEAFASTPLKLSSTMKEIPFDNTTKSDL